MDRITGNLRQQDVVTEMVLIGPMKKTESLHNELREAEKKFLNHHIESLLLRPLNCNVDLSGYNISLYSDLTVVKGSIF